MVNRCRQALQRPDRVHGSPELDHLFPRALPGQTLVHSASDMLRTCLRAASAESAATASAVWLLRPGARRRAAHRHPVGRAWTLVFQLRREAACKSIDARHFAVPAWRKGGDGELQTQQRRRKSPCWWDTARRSPRPSSCSLLRHTAEQPGTSARCQLQCRSRLSDSGQSLRVAARANMMALWLRAFL